jgi:DNA polymerase-1
MDGTGYVFRAFFALPRLSTRDGLPTNALYGFTSMLLRLLRQNPEGLVVAFESGRPSFRKEISPDYKANRPPVAEELKQQLPLCLEMVETLGVRSVAVPGFEADDVIATLCERALAWGMEPVILSSDKDLMQLVSDRVRMIDPIHDRELGPQEVFDKLGVPPEKVLDLLALAGDTSDNIPGVEGIGPKTAAKLLAEFGSLDRLLERADEVKGKRGETLRASREIARQSRQLATLRTDVPLEVSPAQVAPRRPDLAQLRAALTRWEFGGLLRQLPEEWSLTSLDLPAAGPGQAPDQAADQAPGQPPAAGPGQAPGQPPTAGPGQAPASAASSPVGSELALELVTTREAAAALAARCRQRTHLLLRCLAAGPLPLDRELVGLALATGPTQVAYLPVRAPAADGPGLAPGELAELFGPLLADPRLPKTVHDAKVEHEVLATCNIDLRGIAGDPLLGSYLLEPEAKSPTLPRLASQVLGYALPHLPGGPDEAAGSTTAALQSLRALSPRAAGEIVGAETLAVGLLAEHFAAQLTAAGMDTLYREVELPLTRVLARLERLGIALDPEGLQQMSLLFEQRLVELERECHLLAKRPFLVSSPKQLAEVLFDELGLPTTKKTKTARSTDVSVLEELSAVHPLPGKILEYRQVAKLKNTYLDPLPGLVHPRTGRLHTCLNQTVAATGRLSSTEPNLQNIPVRTEEGRRIRAAFVAGPGNVLLSADYSQIELRVLAHLADERALVEAFRRGTDVHAATASELFGVLPGLVDPAQRRAAKAINFGILYGMSAFRLAREQGLPRAQAQRFIDRYFERYPRIRGWIEENLAAARERGYTTTLLGRRRPIPGLRESNHVLRTAAERVATNSPIQGSAADLIKVAMVRLQEAEDAGQLPGRLLLQVHDELLLETAEADADATARVVEEAMRGAAALRVPLEVEVGRGRTWADAH